MRGGGRREGGRVTRRAGDRDKRGVPDNFFPAVAVYSAKFSTVICIGGHTHVSRSQERNSVASDFIVTLNSDGTAPEITGQAGGSRQRRRPGVSYRVPPRGTAYYLFRWTFCKRATSGGFNKTEFTLTDSSARARSNELPLQCSGYLNLRDALRTPLRKLSQ